jgi:hypothetical protein
MTEAKSLFVVLSANATQYNAALRAASRETDRFGDDVDNVHRRLDAGGKVLDSYSSRLGLVVQGLGAVGPAIAPLAAVATAGIGGLAGLLGAATVGALGLVAASHGVTDAFQAMEKARLEPTVANLQAADAAMEGLAPNAQQFVRELQEVLPMLREIRNAGAQGWFGGLNEAIDDLERLEPVATELMTRVGQAGGDSIADSVESLASNRWLPFLHFVAEEAPAAIENLTGIIGNLAHGGAELWQTFDSTNDRFVDWLGDVADGFDRWASSPQGREDVEAFLAYARENGPEVRDFLVEAADAVAELVQAAAPLGGPVLESLTGIVRILGALADSPLGPGLAATATALSVSSLAVRGYQGALAGLGIQAGVTDAALSRIGTVGSFLALATVLPQIQKGLDGILGSYDIANQSDLGRDLSTLLNTGDAVGEIENLNSWLSILDDNLAQATATAFGWVPFDDTTLQQSEESLRKIDQELAAMVEGGRGEEAARIMGEIESRAAELGTSADQLPQIFAEYAQAVENSAVASDAAAGSIRHIGSAADYSRQEIRGLVDAMVEQRQAALGAFDAETQYRQAVVAASAQAQKSNAGIRGSSEAALANRSALGQLAAAWNTQSDAVRNNIDRSREARRNFIQTAVAMGVSEEAARDLARRVLEIPDKAVIRAELDGVQSVRDTLAQLRQDLSNPIVQDVTVRYRGRSYTQVPQDADPDPLRDPTENANGGLYDAGRSMAFADGGYGENGTYYSRSSQIVAGGANILWGEQETGWEAYISGKPSQRARNKAIWSEAGRRLGYDPVRGRGREYVAAAGASTVHHTFEHRVIVTGQLDARRAVAELVQTMRSEARAEIDADHRWRREQGYGG